MDSSNLLDAILVCIYNHAVSPHINVRLLAKDYQFFFNAVSTLAVLDIVMGICKLTVCINIKAASRKTYICGLPFLTTRQPILSIESDTNNFVIHLILPLIADVNVAVI